MIAKDGILRVFIVHMGGPFWVRKDEGAWSIPKGEYDESKEDPREVALREFREEVGVDAPDGEWCELGALKQASGKIVRAYAVESPAQIVFHGGNTFEMEWPKGSGLIRSFPEVDRGEWFVLDKARAKLLEGQGEFLDRLVSALREAGRPFELDSPPEPEPEARF